MKKFLFFSIICLSLVGSLNCFADQSILSAQTPNIHVAIVDLQSAILQTSEGIAARKKIEKEITEKRQELTNKQNQIKKMQEDFQSQQAILSELDKKNKQTEIINKIQEFQKYKIDIDNETSQKENQALQVILQNMQKIVQQIAKQKSFDMVFDKAAGLLYVNQPVDITADVVLFYNKEYKIQK